MNYLISAFTKLSPTVKTVTYVTCGYAYINYKIYKYNNIDVALDIFREITNDKHKNIKEYKLCDYQFTEFTTEKDIEDYIYNFEFRKNLLSGIIFPLSIINDITMSIVNYAIKKKTD